MGKINMCYTANFIIIKGKWPEKERRIVTVGIMEQLINDTLW